ncbi:hypothetical protein BU17DRAFT_59625, partial [Hysterangium stoloniferum]
RSFLPKSIPNARILTYGYDVRTHGENTSQDAMYELSINFLEGLSSSRVGIHKRPLIFVAHSFGGIMLKNALIQATLDNNTHLPKYNGIAIATRGIIYLGTPHRGSNLAKWTHALCDSLSIENEKRDPVLKRLGLYSETLQQQMTKYVVITSKHRYRTVFCYEIHQTVRKGGLSTPSSFTIHAPQLVPSSTASELESTDVEVIGFDKNHMGLVQFTSMNDDDYIHLSQKLLQMVTFALPQRRRILDKFEAISLGNPTDRHELGMELARKGM